MPRCCSCARKGGRDGGERDPDGNGSVAEVMCRRDQVGRVGRVSLDPAQRSCTRSARFASPRHVAVPTPGDLLFHIRVRRMDLCFELAGQLVERLPGAAAVVDELHGFKYFDERDLMGFLDDSRIPPAHQPCSPPPSVTTTWSSPVAAT
jgi:Dyp-type peroxidase family